MSNDAEELLLTTLQRGLEEGLHLYYSAYHARVVDNKDPARRGAVRVQIFGLGETAETDWITPVMQGGPDRGVYAPPEVGDPVRVLFFGGDASKPLAYIPGWLLEGSVPAELAPIGDDNTPYNRGFVTRMGHVVAFSDEPGNEYMRVTVHKPATDDPALSDSSLSANRDTGKASVLEINADGGMTFLLNSGEASLSYQPVAGDGPAGQWLLLDSYGNSITLDSAGVKLIDKKGNALSIADGQVNVISKGAINIVGSTVNLAAGGVTLGRPADSSAVLGEALLLWLATHVHTSTAPTNPTSPPVVPPTPALLSSSVKIKR